jgi:transposase
VVLARYCGVCAHFCRHNKSMPSREPVRRRKRRLRWSPARRCTNKRLAEQGRGAVLALYREGLTKNQIAQRVGVTRSTVTNVLRRNELIEKGKFRDRRCGKKSTVSAAIKARRTKVKMMKEREDRRLKYSGAVALRQSGEFTVSSRTLKRDVNAAGFKYGPRKKAPALKKAPADARVQRLVARFRCSEAASLQVIPPLCHNTPLFASRCLNTSTFCFSGTPARFRLQPHL